MPRRGAVGNHRHRQVGRVRRCVQHFHVQHRGQPAQPLRANAQPVHLVVQLHAHLFGGRDGPAGNQVLNVDRVHQRLFGQQHCLLRRAANADAQHARRTPSRAHRGNGLQHPLHHGVGRVQHGKLALGLRAAALGRHRHVHRRPAHQLHVHHRRRVVFGILPRPRRIGLDGGPQLVVGVQIRAPHAFIRHLLQVELLFSGRSFKAHIHAHLHKDIHDARVLADGPVALETHAAVDQDLRHCILRGVRLLALIGFGQAGNVIHRVVIADVLQCPRHTRNKIFLPDHGHCEAPSFF